MTAGDAPHKQRTRQYSRISLALKHWKHYKRK